MGEQVTADVLHPLLTRLRQQPVNTISESDRIIISRDATSCYRKLVVHKLAPPQEQCGALENIAVALLHLSGRARSHAVKDAYSLWYKMKKRSRHTSRLDKWVRRMQELEKKLAQPFSSDYYVSSEDPVPERLALVNLLYQDLDSKQLPRELARLRVLGEKVHSVADLPAVLANQCPEQQGFASAPPVPPPCKYASPCNVLRCTSCQSETPLELVTDMLRHRPRTCKYARRWLAEFGSSSPNHLTEYRCTNCILDAAMAAGRLKRQGQLCSKSTELAWTQIKCGLRLPLACTFESGKLLLGCKRGKIGALLSGEGTVRYSLVVLNGELCELITGKAFWGTLLKGSEWDVGPSGAATALAGGLRMYSATTAQWAGTAESARVAACNADEDDGDDGQGSGGVQWGLVVVADSLGWACAQALVHAASAAEPKDVCEASVHYEGDCKAQHQAAVRIRQEVSNATAQLQVCRAYAETCTSAPGGGLSVPTTRRSVAQHMREVDRKRLRSAGMTDAVRRASAKSQVQQAQKRLDAATREMATSPAIVCPPAAHATVLEGAVRQHSVLLYEMHVDGQTPLWQGSVPADDCTVRVDDPYRWSANVHAAEDAALLRLGEERLVKRLEKGTACDVCAAGEWQTGNELLMCSNFSSKPCKCCRHLRCFDPPLTSIPEDGWLCRACADPPIEPFLPLPSPPPSPPPTRRRGRRWSIFAVFASCFGFARAGGTAADYAGRMPNFRPPPGASPQERAQLTRQWEAAGRPMDGGGGGVGGGGGDAGDDDGDVSVIDDEENDNADGDAAGPEQDVDAYEYDISVMSSSGSSSDEDAAAEPPCGPERRPPTLQRPMGLAGEAGHSTSSARFGEFDEPLRFAQERNVRRYLGVQADGMHPPVHLWWTGAEEPTGDTPITQAAVTYRNKKGKRVTWDRLNAPGRARDLPCKVGRAAVQTSGQYRAYMRTLATSRLTAMCLAQSLGFARGEPLSSVCAGESGTAKCAWTTGITELRERALEYDDVGEFVSCTTASAYRLSCHVGMHVDSRDEVPEFIAERFSPRMAEMSADGRRQTRSCRHGLQGRVITPEFGHWWKLRPCRDIGHMAWNQVAHFSPKLSTEQQIVGDAGGGVVKYVGS